MLLLLLLLGYHIVSPVPFYLPFRRLHNSFLYIIDDEVEAKLSRTQLQEGKKEVVLLGALLWWLFCLCLERWGPDQMIIRPRSVHRRDMLMLRFIFIRNSRRYDFNLLFVML